MLKAALLDCFPCSNKPGISTEIKYSVYMLIVLNALFDKSVWHSQSDILNLYHFSEDRLSQQLALNIQL